MAETISPINDADPTQSFNLLLEGCVGCYIVRHDTSWLLGTEEVAPRPVGGGDDASSWSTVDSNDESSGGEEIGDDGKRIRADDSSRSNGGGGGASDGDSEPDAVLVEIIEAPKASGRKASKHAKKSGAMGTVVRQKQQPCGVLAVVNRSTHERVVYLSASVSRSVAGGAGSEHNKPKSMTLIGSDQRQLWIGESTLLPAEDDDGVAVSSRSVTCRSDHSAVSTVPCVTFICLIPALTCFKLTSVLMDEWYSPGGIDVAHLDFRHTQHNDPQGTLQDVVPRLSFPFYTARTARRGVSSVSSVDGDDGGCPRATGPWLCTQGFGGALTHFFPESYHAIDFRCDEGTPLLSMCDGTVTEIRETDVVTGIHCHNLTAWNSIAVTNKSRGYVCEFVHIAPGSAAVNVGDTVRAGDVIALSGNVGFVPEPHVHIELHRADPNAVPGAKVTPSASLMFEFGVADGHEGDMHRGAGGNVDHHVDAFVPIAGCWYDDRGLCQPPPHTRLHTL